jgi:hypothetical protein
MEITHKKNTGGKKIMKYQPRGCSSIGLPRGERIDGNVRPKRLSIMHVRRGGG